MAMVSASLVQKKANKQTAKTTKKNKKNHREQGLSYLDILSNSEILDTAESIFMQLLRHFILGNRKSLWTPTKLWQSITALEYFLSQPLVRMLFFTCEYTAFSKTLKKNYYSIRKDRLGPPQPIGDHQKRLMKYFSKMAIHFYATYIRIILL